MALISLDQIVSPKGSIFSVIGVQALQASILDGLCWTSLGHPETLENFDGHVPETTLHLNWRTLIDISQGWHLNCQLNVASSLTTLHGGRAEVLGCGCGSIFSPSYVQLLAVLVAALRTRIRAVGAADVDPTTRGRD